MPTAIAPMTENTVCHVSDGMVCFTMPWVAWNPATTAGATKAAAMSRRAQVGRTVARERAAVLREANARRRHLWMDGLTGMTTNMLVERDGRSGHGENFVGLMLNSEAMPGSIVPVRIGARDGDRMIAERVA